jgi:hypothetical protein
MTDTVYPFLKDKWNPALPSCGGEKILRCEFMLGGDCIVGASIGASVVGVLGIDLDTGEVSVCCVVSRVIVLRIGDVVLHVLLGPLKELDDFRTEVTDGGD